MEPSCGGDSDGGLIPHFAGAVINFTNVFNHINDTT
jgi:hypothetical protein